MSDLSRILDDLHLNGEAAWRACWGLVRMEDHPRFLAALPLLGTSKGVLWILVDRDRLVWAAVVPTILRGRCGANVAARGAVLAMDDATALADGVARQGLISSGFGFETLAHGLPFADPTAPLDRTGPLWRPHARQCQPWQAIARAECDAFLAFLDPDALAARGGVLKKRPLRSAGAYNHFAGAWAAPGIPVRVAGERRRQAQALMPLFSVRMRTDRTVRDAIDANAPLVRALAISYGCTLPPIRVVAALELRLAHMATVLAMLDAMPGDWVAARPDQALALAQILLRLGLVAGGRDDPSAPAVAWRGLVSGLVRRGGPLMEVSAFGLDALEHVRDCGRALVEEIVVPELAARGHLPAQWDVALRDQLGVLWLASTRSLPALMALSGDHLAALIAAGAPRLRGHLRPDHQLTSDLRWPRAIPDCVSPKDVSFHELCSQDELNEEGQTMAHCVAGYGWRCASGECRIVAVSGLDADGVHTRLATLQLEQDLAGRWRETQHRAVRNAAPSKGAREGARWLVGALNSGGLRALAAVPLATSPDSAETMDAAAAGAPEAAGAAPALDQAAAEVMAVCGFDWRSEEARGAAWERWRRLLGGRWRRMDTLGFLLACPDEVLATDPDCPLRGAIRRLKEAAAVDLPEAPAA